MEQPEEQIAVRPHGNRLLVELEPLQTMSDGGLHLPQNVRENAMNRADYRWGKVLAVGNGRWLSKAKRFEPVPFEAGARVLFNAWVADPTKIDVQNPTEGRVLVEVDDVAGVDE
jgi:co-chaperonin GroES (HSP10)